ncbi:centromere protein F [Conger conger]|uniref:centromere protein F n=1 Tax=Conger conger TaxID=82655 RepID=UPI002A59C17E|nr:centromere protein F [Conger conger]
MSWTVDDWAAGLSGTALQKVRELQAQQDRLQREKQQRQLQLDSTEAALCKQKQKFEEVRVELAGVRRDLQSSQEEVLVGVRERNRLSQDLQVKQAQVCSLEGQLDSARTLSQTLTQEVKRLEAELEKLQNANSSGDAVLFSTPCWNPSSRENSGSRWEQKDSSGGDSDLKALHVRQLQFAENSPKPAPSPFPWQQSTPPSARRNRQPKPPPSSSAASAVFPWEREEASSGPRGRPASVTAPSGGVIERSGPEDAGKDGDVRRENDIQRSKIAELQTWVQSLEQEVRSASDRHRETEARLGEARGELAAREQTLSRAKEEVVRANSHVEKEKDRAQAAEQRVKQLQEELSCQRQNAESSRRSAEQRWKDLEREHQRELLELQKESQAREKQHQQESGRLNQELQMARTLHNTLQAQCDKVLLQKQALEKDLDSVRGKLQWTEKELQECQKREAQIQGKLTEALRERDNLGLSLEHSGQRVKGLEQEVKRLAQELAEALRLLAELQAKLAVPAAPTVPTRCIPVGDSFSSPVTPHRPSHVPKKKVNRTEKPREEEQDQRAKYPTDREPGEGIDSDFIGEFGSQAPEKPKGEGGRARKEADRRGSITREAEEEKSDKTCVHDDGASTKEQVDAGTDQGETVQRDVKVSTKDEKQGHNSSDGDTQPEGVGVQSQDSSGPKGQHSAPSLQDLKSENVALRDDLKEAKRELEQRLEDLEAQRRAETEARTKLKQLSRKNSSQVEQLRQKTQELKEEGGRLEKQLEEERKESGRLRDSLDALEGERREEQTEKNRGDEEARTAMDKLRADLAALESELRKEQEDKEREKEDGERERLKDEECRRALTEKVAELQSEVEELRNSKWEGENGNEETDKPLTPLILELNSNNNNAVAMQDDNFIPSPTESISLSDSAGAETPKKEEIDLITEEGAKSSKHPVEIRGPYPGKPTVDGSQMSEKLLDSDEVVQLVLEVERLRGACVKLRGEKDREAGRAKQTQAKLEVLQNQVTNQTKQLTLAFENQSSNIKDLLGELQVRDSTLQRLEDELQGCHGEIAEMKAEKLKLKQECEGFGKPEETGPEQMAFQTPSTPGKGAIPDIEAEQTAERNSLHDSGQSSLSSISPTEQVSQSINNDGSVKDLQAELRDLKAENEELQSKLAAAATVNGSNCVNVDQSALIGDGATQRLVGELEAAKEDLRKTRAKNEELQSLLSQAELSKNLEKRPLDSEVKQGPFYDSQQNVIVSGDLGAHTEVAKGRVEAFGNQDFQTEQREELTLKNEELTLMVETPSLLEGSRQRTVSTGQKTLDAHSESSKDAESDIDVQHNRNTIIKLQAENQALRSWALAVCPPDRQGEIDKAISDSGRNRGSNSELGDGGSRLTQGANLADEGSTGVERVVVSEEGSQSDKASQLLLNMPPAQELTSSRSNDGLNLERGKDMQEQIQAESRSLKSGEMDDTPQQANYTDKTGMEQNRFSPSEITALQKQLAELQTQVSSLREENVRQAEELEVWRVTGEPISPLLMEETAIHPRQGSIAVVREDQLLLTCKGEELIGSRHMVGEVRVLEFGGQDLSEKSPAPSEGVDGEDPPVERTQESLGNAEKLPVTIQVPTDTNVITDLKTKAMVHRDVDIGTKTRTNSHDVSHPRPVTVEGDDSSKVTHTSNQTKTTEHTHRDDQENGANYFDSKTKAAGCRISEAHIEAASPEDSQAKAFDHRETHATVIENAGAVSEKIEPVKGTQRLESPHQPTLCTVNTNDFTTDSGKAHRDSGSSVLEEKGKELQTTKSFFRTENSQKNCVQTNTETDNKHGLTKDALCMEPETTEGNTLTTSHRQLQDSTTKLVCPGVESGNEPEHSAPCWPKVVTRDFQTQTDVESESLASSGLRAGGGREGGVCKELRTTATQTDSDSGGMGPAGPAPPAGGGGIQHSSTQTEPVEMQDEDLDTSNEEQNSESPPLSPTPMPEGGPSLLFTGSFFIPSDPARLAERIRRNRSRMSAAYDDTEYEPYGLPEVVMKGFADIPSGPACPYVLRRGLLGTDALPLPLREQPEEEQEEPDP